MRHARPPVRSGPTCIAAQEHRDHRCAPQARTGSDDRDISTRWGRADGISRATECAEKISMEMPRRCDRRQTGGKRSRTEKGGQRLCRFGLQRPRKIPCIIHGQAAHVHEQVGCGSGGICRDQIGVPESGKCGDADLIVAVIEGAPEDQQCRGIGAHRDRGASARSAFTRTRQSVSNSASRRRGSMPTRASCNFPRRTARFMRTSGSGCCRS